MPANGSYVDDMKARFEHAFYNQERYADFLEWLFDTELDYTTQPEMWKKFEEWEDSQEHTKTSSSGKEATP